MLVVMLQYHRPSSMQRGRAPGVQHGRYNVFYYMKSSLQQWPIPGESFNCNTDQQQQHVTQGHTQVRTVVSVLCFNVL